MMASDDGVRHWTPMLEVTGECSGERPFRRSDYALMGKNNKIDL
jgi:hypothetical protein